MTLAVVGTLSTNKQSYEQKDTNKNTQFQHDVLRDNKYGNGFWVNFIELEAPKQVPGIRKRKTSLSYQRTPNRSNKDKKLIPARNSHITSALNLITYVYMYMCISSTSAAILMTSSFGPDAELRCVNWFKLLHMPQSLFDIGHQKSSQNLHEIPIRHRL